MGAVSPGILLAFLAAVLLVIERRAVSSPSPRTLLPFAPFMAGGALVAVFASQ
jgi:prepilin signal peptidase PulO-like enzyme (type II secretory pathway)